MSPPGQRGHYPQCTALATRARIHIHLCHPRHEGMGRLRGLRVDRRHLLRDSRRCQLDAFANGCPHSLLQSFHLLDQIQERIHHLCGSLNTEKTFLYWLRFLILWRTKTQRMAHRRDSNPHRSNPPPQAIQKRPALHLFQLICPHDPLC